MRSLSTRRADLHEEEESVFVSMTDMTVSFLFIVMILLAFFASRFSDEEVVPLDVFEPVREERDTLRLSLERTQERLSASQAQVAELMDERDVLRSSIADLEARLTQALARAEALREALIRTEAERDGAQAQVVKEQDRVRALEAEIAALSEQLARLRRPDPLKAYIAQVAAQRKRVLERLRDDLLVDFPELEGVVTSESDVLRFQGEGLFASSSDRILEERIPVIERIAERLDALLPCYTLGPRADHSQDCNPAFAVIEAVQIEGHTDSDGADALNVTLSALRGAATYATMTAHETGLIEHRNLAGQPVLSIAGYGEGRPVTGNDTAAGKATNRRIDLRFIMVTPGENAEIGRIRARLSGGRQEDGEEHP